MSYTGLSALARASLAKSGKWASGIAAVGGFASDVLNPLGPVAGYIALASLALAVALALAALFKFLAADRAAPAIVFAVISCVVTGGIYSLQQAEDAENGILAKLVPAVAQVQQSVGLISAKIDKIDAKVTQNLEATNKVQQTAEAVQQQASDIQKQTAEVKQQTADIAAAVEQIAEGFKTLGNQGGVIANPERPDQFYHNARIQELGGDILNARQFYLGFARFNVDAVDAYSRFATLLKVSEGRSGARDVIGALRETNKTKSLELVWTQLLDDSQRRQALETFAKANADFGPAQFALADEYSENRLGTRTLSEKKSEKAALDAFQTAGKDGRLVKYFVDQTVLADWSAQARSRLASLGDLDALAAPAINAMRAGQGWQMTIQLPEPAASISWRLAETGQFVDTGTLAFNDQQTGKPMANPGFQLPADAKAGDIELKYVDLRGAENGPFRVRFDPAAALVGTQRSMAEQSWTSWIVFDASGFRGNVYFTGLVSFACAISNVAYGINGSVPDKALKLPACNPDKPFELPDGFLPYFKVSEEVKSIAVEVTWSDGSKSGVKTFNRP